MTTATKERIKTDWDQAKQDSKERAGRIREILQAAASATFSEIKSGSADLNELTRKSAGVWLEEVTKADGIDVADGESSGESSNEIHSTEFHQTSDDGEPVGAEPVDSEHTVPTWRDLFLQTLGLVRDRKGDWFQQFLNHWNEQTAKFDADMNKEHGDRYQKVKSRFQQLITWVKATRHQETSSETVQDAQPVNIEVIDENGTVISAESKGL
ncbi:MAG: hypothetical protein AAFY20_07635 [Cyanobacteria bacterium J06639_14]